MERLSLESHCSMAVTGDIVRSLLPSPEAAAMSSRTRAYPGAPARFDAMAARDWERREGSGGPEGPAEQGGLQEVRSEERFSSGQRAGHPWGRKGKSLPLSGAHTSLQRRAGRDSRSVRLLLGPLLTSSPALGGPGILAVWVSQSIWVSGTGYRTLGEQSPSLCAVGTQGPCPAGVS